LDVPEFYIEISFKVIFPTAIFPIVVPALLTKMEAISIL